MSRVSLLEIQLPSESSEANFLQLSQIFLGKDELSSLSIHYISFTKEQCINLDQISNFEMTKVRLNESHKSVFTFAERVYS